jgi:hypothetical protein
MRVVKGDWMGRSFGWDRKTKVPCHSRCGTIKIPPCSKAMSTEHRPKFCSPSMKYSWAGRKTLNNECRKYTCRYYNAADSVKTVYSALLKSQLFWLRCRLILKKLQQLKYQYGEMFIVRKTYFCNIVPVRSIPRQEESEIFSTFHNFFLLFPLIDG